MTKKRTSAYVGTFNYHHPEDLQMIAEIRNEIKQRYHGKKRLKLQGRLGINRDEAITQKYAKKKKSGFCPPCVELADSAYVDAYIYNRYDDHPSLCRCLHL
jgi:hypothetical protein